MRVSLLIFSTTACLLSGCSSLTSPGRSRQLENDKPYWFDYGADRRGALLVPKKNGDILMCSEPVPRVTTNLGASASGNYNNGPSLPENGVQAGVGGEVRSGNSVVKEESIILFLRDAMFNLCEMSINLSDTDIEHKRLVLGKYSEVIDAALTLSGRTEGVLREQNKKRALDRYLDILFQAQRSNSDALELSLKESENLQKQLSEMRYLLDVSLQEIKKDIQTLKPLSE